MEAAPGAAAAMPESRLCGSSRIPAGFSPVLRGDVSALRGRDCLFSAVFRDPASPNAACGIFVVVLLAFFFGKRPRGERFSSFFFDSPLQNNALKIPFSEEKRNEAQAFAVEVARLSIRHFQMPSPERDPEKLRLQLRRLREESILSGEEVRELEKWYAIAGEERPNIGFLRKEDA